MQANHKVFNKLMMKLFMTATRYGKINFLL